MFSAPTPVSVPNDNHWGKKTKVDAANVPLSLTAAKVRLSQQYKDECHFVLLPTRADQVKVEEDNKRKCTVLTC